MHESWTPWKTNLCLLPCQFPQLHPSSSSHLLPPSCLCLIPHSSQHGELKACLNSTRDLGTAWPVLALLISQPVDTCMFMYEGGGEAGKDQWIIMVLWVNPPFLKLLCIIHLCLAFLVCQSLLISSEPLTTSEQTWSLVFNVWWCLHEMKRHQESYNALANAPSWFHSLSSHSKPRLNSFIHRVSQSANTSLPSVLRIDGKILLWLLAR